MKLWLTKCHGGRYMMTFMPPVIAQIRGSKHDDAFEQVGEPIAVRHLCEDGVRSLFGFTLEPLVPTRVEVAGRKIEVPA